MKFMRLIYSLNVNVEAGYTNTKGLTYQFYLQSLLFSIMLEKERVCQLFHLNVYI